MKDFPALSDEGVDDAHELVSAINAAKHREDLLCVVFVEVFFQKRYQRVVKRERVQRHGNLVAGLGPFGFHDNFLPVFVAFGVEIELNEQRVERYFVHHEELFREYRLVFLQLVAAVAAAIVVAAAAAGSGVGAGFSGVCGGLAGLTDSIVHDEREGHVAEVDEQSHVDHQTAHHPGSHVAVRDAHTPVLRELALIHVHCNGVAVCGGTICLHA
mmetsp:Transcript_22203/g.39341  ORF Transcript_22203/g.39341 Transcript_22203/m.39341 type:complete len:214 (-) Transcript_22203:523-1164(-)